MRHALLCIAACSLLSACPGDGPLTPNPPPTASSVSPSVGPWLGGAVVTISGTGFVANDATGAQVLFGSARATEVTVVGDTTITCTVPAGEVDTTVDVTVSNRNGSAVVSDAYRYSDQFLFAADGRSGREGSLWVIDPDSAEARRLHDMDLGLTGLAFDDDGTLWGVQSTFQCNTDSDSHLVTVDPVTGAVQTSGPLVDGAGTQHCAVADITFVGERLIGWSILTDGPVEIDTASGEVTAIGNDIVDSNGSGLAAVPGGTVWFAPGGRTDALYEVDPITGNAVAGPALSGGQHTTLNAMTFLGDRLFAIDATRMGRPNGAALVEIDTSTGEITTVGAVPVYIDSLAAPQ
jgi:hypothetical protein